MAAKLSTNSYVLCIDNGGYPESLEVRKVYAVVPDDRADARQYVRVIDETGEDYLSIEVFRTNPTATRSCKNSAYRKLSM
jgi:hypothetical protein